MIQEQRKMQRVRHAPHVYKVFLYIFLVMSCFVALKQLVFPDIPL